MPRGKPFQKGVDPRRNLGGRQPTLLSRAMQSVMSEQDAEAILSTLIASAKDGNIQAIQMLWDRMEGKAIARQESGEPGAFELDLSEIDSEALRAAFKRVK